MTNRFEHLKKTNKEHNDVNKFIEKADDLGTAKLAKKSVSKENIILSIAGKMDREQECDKKPILLHLKKDISNDIDKYCHGNKQAIINYLVRKGLDELIKHGELILVTE